jgi:hypothetical protein
MKTYTYGMTPIDVIKTAIEEQTEEFTMELVGNEREMMTGIINQGIDSHLEAFTSSDFKDNGHRLFCKVSAPDMLVLLRRLTESDSEDAMSLRTSILDTYEIEEV